MEDPVPQFVAYGENIEYTKHLMQASKGIRNKSLSFIWGVGT